LAPANGTGLTTARFDEETTHSGAVGGDPTGMVTGCASLTDSTVRYYCV